MKQCLVLSDNPAICKRIFLINNKLGISNHFDFGTSIFSDIAQFSFINNEIKVYNLKDEDSLCQIINNYKIVISIHYKQLFPVNLLKNVRCYNLHPGYNPINRGWYPQVFAIIKDTEIGATFHEIDSEIDNGDIIYREIVPKFPWDTSFDLYNRVVDKEVEIYERFIECVISNEYTKIKPESGGVLHLKKDFNELLQIDLNKNGTYKEFIDLLRALTFDKYDNAYFIDDSGNKIFISINLKKSD